MMNKKEILFLAFCVVIYSVTTSYAQIRRGGAGSIISRGTGVINLSNGEQLENSTDGDVCIKGVGGTNNEDICFDVETTANEVDIQSTTGANLTTSLIFTISGTLEITGTLDGGTGILITGTFSSDPCNAAREGAIFYNATKNVHCFCDGTNDLEINDGTACF